MKGPEYYLLDVFTDRAFAGNPLALFPQAEGLEHLAQKKGVGPWRWQIEQGIEMGRPSRILVEAIRGEDDQTIRIAGQAVIVGSSTLRWAE